MSSNDIRLTVVGNLCDEPELRFTPSGVAVASFVVAVNPRRFDKQSNEWTDDDPSFVRCQVWRQLAENVVESLSKGDRVIAVGTFREERWETDKGEKRAAWRLTADAVGPDLTYARASVSRVRRRSTDDVPPGDPWSTATRTRPTSPAPASVMRADDGDGPLADDEPPF